MTEQTEEPKVKGISRADYQSWKHHPVSKVVLEYLADKRIYMERAAIDQWVGGVLSLSADQTLRGQIIELHELISMPFEAMAMFYDEESNAAEIAENQPS